MKLIILPVLLVTVVWADVPRMPGPMETRACCPCNEPADTSGPPESKAAVIFTVDTPNYGQGQPKELIKQLIGQLIKKEIIDVPTANQILNAFGVPLPFGIPVVISLVPLSPLTIPGLPIGGRPDAAKPFKHGLSNLAPTRQANEAKEPTLIKILLELLLNNRVPTLQVIKTTVEYGIFITVHAVTKAVPPGLIVEPWRTPPPLVIEKARTPPPLVLETGRTPPPLVLETGRTPPPLVLETGRTPPPLVLETGRTPPRLVLETGRTPPPLILETGRTPPRLVIETARTPPRPVVELRTTPAPPTIDILEPPPFPVIEIPPGEPGTSTVIITTIEDRVVPPAINKILEILVIKKIIEPQVASSILITYGIKPQPPFNSNEGTKLTPEKLSKIPIVIGDQPRQKFIIDLIEFLKTPNPSKPTLIKIFITFLLDNGIVDLPTIQKFFITYNIIGKLNFKPQPPEPVFPLDQLLPGQPGQTTLILTSVEPNLTPSIINKLMEILINKKIITVPTANTILSTFDVPGRNPFNPIGVSKLTPQTVTTLQVIAPEEPRDKLITDLTKLISQPSHPQLIKILLTFLLDSGTINLPTAQKFLTIYRIVGHLEFQSIPPVAVPVLEKGIDPGNNMIIDSSITVTGTTRPLKPLIKFLVDLVVKNNLLTPQIGEFILITFGITAPIQSTGPIPSIQLNLGGKPGPAEKFKNNFAQLLVKSPSTASHSILVKILTELLIDNLVVHHNSAVKLLAAYGVSTNVNIQFIPAKGTGAIVITNGPEPTFTVDKVIGGDPGVSTLTITSIEDKLVPSVVNSLLEILVAKGVFDVTLANSLLATFGIPGRGRFNPSGAAKLTIQTVTSIRLNAQDEAKERFITTLTTLLTNQSKSGFVHSLITLLLDNGTCNLQTIQIFLTIFRIAGKVQFQPTPAVKEPILEPGQDPGEELVIDSTVTITTVVRPLPPLIKRLVQLTVQYTLLNQEIANNILVTFGIDAPGGIRLTQASITTLSANSKQEVWEKFINNLTPMLANPSSAHHTQLIKVLTELLIDNASLSANSASQLLVAYGIGVQVNVEFVRKDEVGLTGPDENQ